MLAAMKRLALVMLITALPTQGLAAIIIPFCQLDTSATALTAHQHSHANGHDYDASASNHEPPIVVSVFGSDHCSTGVAFAIPAMSTGPAPAATAEPSWFAAAYRSGFIPEQPQRPPLV